MKLYYIYHVPGIKIGCTEQPSVRLKKQGFNNWEILETYTDIYEASNRERLLQLEYGYRVDESLYYKSRSKWGSYASSKVKNRHAFTTQQAKEAGLKGVKNHWINNKDAALTNALIAISKATQAASISPNRASLQTWYCKECNRTIIGAGPAGVHRKKNNHTIERL
jgi:hypothetical protein